MDFANLVKKKKIVLHERTCMMMDLNVLIKVLQGSAVLEELDLANIKSPSRMVNSLMHSFIVALFGL